MKVIMPVAGYGKRLRPHTWSKPKPLLNVAGKPVLAHTLDMLKPLGVEELVFITGWMGEEIRAFVEENYDYRAHYVVQEELKGQAHALYLAREHLNGPCLIIFVDTLFEAYLSFLDSCTADAVIFVKEIDDPRPFGVIVEQEGRVVRYIEKPQGFEYRKTTIGVFWVKEGAELVRAIEHLLQHDIRTRGEYYLADAINVMIDQGAWVIGKTVSVWEDCGRPDTLLHTNRYLLEHGHAQQIETADSVLIPPVHISKTARIQEAVIGPYVTIGDEVTIKRCIIRDAIIEAGTHLENMIVEHSLLGRNVRVIGRSYQLNIGDDDQIVSGAVAKELQGGTHDHRHP